MVSSPHKKVTLHTPEETNKETEQSSKVHVGISPLVKGNNSGATSSNIQVSYCNIVDSFPYFLKFNHKYI